MQDITDGGNTFSPDYTTNRNLHAVSGSAPNDLWVVGDNGAMLRYFDPCAPTNTPTSTPTNTSTRTPTRQHSTNTPTSIPTNASTNTPTFTSTPCSGLGILSFAPAVTYNTGGIAPEAVAIGDMNGDGTPDVVAGDANSHDVAVMLGVGNGTLQPATNYSVINNPYSVALADFNNNRKLNVVAGNTGVNVVSVLLGTAMARCSLRSTIPRAMLSTQ